MENQSQGGDVMKTLGIDRPQGGGRRLWRWLLAALMIAALAAAALLRGNDNSGSVRYATQKAERGDLIVTVTATGKLQPVKKVDVGTEVSGTIKTVEVGYSDRVKVGQVLARLDTDNLETQVLQSQAALKSASARVIEAGATVKEKQGELLRLQKVRQLSEGRLPSERELEAAEASLKRAEAQEATAAAQMEEAQTKLKINETNLSKAVIRSPIEGMVLDRKVEPGQTVAASLQAPVLFTLAETLTQMLLYVDVDEADVGRIKKGQRAAFTVDAYPERNFEARITEVRYAPKTSEGVVTYEALLAVDNAEMLLRPGMTATAEITVREIRDALLVPNAALRFTPATPQKSAQGGGIISKLLPRRPGGMMQRQKEVRPKEGRRLYVLKDGRPSPVPVTVGLTDGRMSELTKGDIEPGQPIIVDIERQVK